LTTLSTIGYGDFLPKQQNEKIFVSIILLSGVTIFSLIMNNLMDILSNFKDIGKEGDTKNLSKFVLLLAKFNNGLPMSRDIITKIEDFFDYYWVNDILRALKTE
jgi:hypothetical protein